jgi:hypothetical protein
MAKPSSNLSIAISKTDKPKLSSAQRKFNNLIKKIEKQRQLLQFWQAALPRYQQRWHEEYEPLHKQCRALDTEFVRLLDEAGDHIKLAKADRQTLQAIICEVVTSLMDGENDDLMKVLYNKHSGGDFDADEQAENEILKQAMEQAYGIELEDDIDFDSPEALAEKLQEHWHNEQAREHQEREERLSRHKKTARQLRQEEQALQASQSVREVYRKLASLLHPDRETDAGERERKTVLMQRVNQAYAERNLLDLLQLQLEAEQLDQSALNNLAEDRLAHYNQILTEQHSELSLEVSDIELAFSVQFNLEPFTTITPSNIEQKFQRPIHDLRFEILDIEEQLVALQDPKALKSWLKEQRYQMEEDDLFSAFSYG